MTRPVQSPVHGALVADVYPIQVQWSWRPEQPLAVTLTVATIHGPRPRTFARDTLAEGLLGCARAGVAIMPDGHKPVLYIGFPEQRGLASLRLTLCEPTADEFLAATWEQIRPCGSPANCVDRGCMECVWSRSAVADALVRMELVP